MAEESKNNGEWLFQRKIKAAGGGMVEERERSLKFHHTMNGAIRRTRVKRRARIIDLRHKAMTDSPVLWVKTKSEREPELVI